MQCWHVFYGATAFSTNCLIHIYLRLPFVPFSHSPTACSPCPNGGLSAWRTPQAIGLLNYGQFASLVLIEDDLLPEPLEAATPRPGSRKKRGARPRFTVRRNREGALKKEERGHLRVEFEVELGADGCVALHCSVHMCIWVYDVFIFGSAFMLVWAYWCCSCVCVFRTNALCTVMAASYRPTRDTMSSTPRNPSSVTLWLRAHCNPSPCRALQPLPCARRHEVTMQVVEARDLSVKHGKPHAFVKVEVLTVDPAKPLYHRKTKVGWRIAYQRLPFLISSSDRADTT